jgi:hypothetical protein
MDRVQERAESLLATAHESEASMAALFTRFGCHAFAFAAVRRLGGTTVLMTEMLDLTWGPSRCVHAWCETHSAAIDYFGQASGPAAILERFLSQPGFSPPWRPEMKPYTVESLDRPQIDLVLAGSRTLPNGFYGDPVWLRRAVCLADHLLADKYPLR